MIIAEKLYLLIHLIRQMAAAMSITDIRRKTMELQINLRKAQSKFAQTSVENLRVRLLQHRHLQHVKNMLLEHSKQPGSGVRVIRRIAIPRRQPRASVSLGERISAHYASLERAHHENKENAIQPPLERQDSQSPLELQDSQPPLERQDSQSPLERQDSQSPLERQDSQSPLEADA